MKMKAKLFEIKNKTDASDINTWLKANPNIEIIATNTFANDHGWGYMLIYQTKNEKEMVDEE